MERIESIQYLRAVAALGVVAFHVLEATPAHFLVGSAGVDIFFVVSGFIIGVIALQSNASPLSFFWRRCLRVLPPYWGATALIFVIVAIHPSAFSDSDLSFSNVWQSLLLIPHTDANGSPDPLLVQGWTLYYEMFFYLLAALAICAPMRLRAPLIVAVLVALVVSSAVFNGGAWLWIFYTNPLLLEFVAGLSIALAWRAGRIAPLAVGVLCVAVGVGVFAFDAALALHQEIPRILIWGAPAALIVLGVVSMENAGAMPRIAPLRILGDASYSLYLLHMIAFAAVTWAVGKTPLDLPLYMMVALKIAAAVASALAFYAVFERPLLLRLRTLPKALSGPAVAKA